MLYNLRQRRLRLDELQIKIKTLDPCESATYWRYFSNHASVRSCISTLFFASVNICPSPAYTTSSVGTPSVRSACQNSYDCGAGHSASRSPTMTSVGVFTCLINVM